MPQDGFFDAGPGFEADLTMEQPQGPPMPSEQSTSRMYDPITAGLIHDTPSPDEVFRAIRSTPVINPLAIMRGQQPGPQMLPSTILKAQRMSAVKERAQLLALLQDNQTHDIQRQRLATEQSRLAYDVMRQTAAQGNAGVGAVYKTFTDISKDMDPDQANKWLDTLMKQDVSQGVPNEAAGRQLALQSLVQAGGIKAKEKLQKAPSGFQFTPEGGLEAIPGGPNDPNVIRQSAEARHITVNVGGGVGRPQRPPVGYRWTPQGDLEAIPGGPGDPATQQGMTAAKKSAVLAQTQVKDLTEIDQQDATIAAAIKDVQQTPTAYGGQRSIALGAAKGLGGKMGGSVAERNLFSPEEIQARSSMFNQVSAVIKERAGTAQTKQELDRINAFLPSEYDDPNQILAKLKGFRNYLAEKRSGITPYIPGTTQSIAPDPIVGAPTPPVAMPPRPQHAAPEPAPGYYPTPGPGAAPSVTGQKVRKFNPVTGRVE